MPDSKNLRLLVSSSLLEERSFIMKILQTNILGMNIAIWAEGALKPMDDSIKFGFYLNVIGSNFTF